MYAVIETGGKQYRVELGSEIQVDRLDVSAGDSITLDRVLLVADGGETAIGRPVVDGATVSAEVVGQIRGEKIVVFKYKPKARHRVKKGFRAELTKLRISDIAFGGRSAASDAQEAQSKKSKDARDAEKAAADKAAADQALAAQLGAKEAASAKAAEPAPAEPAPAKTEASEKKSTAAKSTTTRKKRTTKAAAETSADGSAVADPDAAAVDETSASEAGTPRKSSTDSSADKKDE